MPKISIIVPVYKAEGYLERCVNSILSQSFADFELILVDDGSPDQCPKLCDVFAGNDNRVRVIHQKNAGVSAARNAGLDTASGEYITFVDSDDYIDPRMYEEMMWVARRYDCDVVMCDCIKELEDHTEVYSHEIRPGYYDTEQLKQEYFPHLIMMGNVEYPPTISNCLCLFRRKADTPRYVEGVRFSEDLLFGAQLMHRARSFYYMKGQTFYHYCMNAGSASHSFVPDKWNDYVRLHTAAEAYFLAVNDYDFQHQLDLMLLFLLYNAVGSIKGALNLTNTEKKREILRILREDRVQAMFKRVHVLQLPVTWKLRIMTLMYKYQKGIHIAIVKG